MVARSARSCAGRAGRAATDGASAAGHPRHVAEPGAADAGDAGRHAARLHAAGHDGAERGHAHAAAGRRHHGRARRFSQLRLWPRDGNGRGYGAGRRSDQQDFLSDPNRTLKPARRTAVRPPNRQPVRCSAHGAARSDRALATWS